MRFITNKIRIKANSVLPLASRHNDPANNPYYDMETPEEKAFSASKPAKIAPTTRAGMTAGVHGAQFHYDASGMPTGVAKDEGNHHLKEPLAYQLSKHIVPGMVPMTVARSHKSAKGMSPHSVQAVVPNIEDGHWSDEEEHMSNPQIASMAMFDHLIGNGDRHIGNIIQNRDADGTPKYHAIDNGEAFGYPQSEDEPYTTDLMRRYTDHSASWEDERKKKFAGTPIPPETRARIMALQNEQGDLHPGLAQVFDRAEAGHPFTMHSKNIRPGFTTQLSRMRQHLADPEVRTMGELARRLEA